MVATDTQRFKRHVSWSTCTRMTSPTIVAVTAMRLGQNAQSRFPSMLGHNEKGDKLLQATRHVTSSIAE